jgi:hypothetical protein
MTTGVLPRLRWHKRERVEDSETGRAQAAILTPGDAPRKWIASRFH